MKSTAHVSRHVVTNAIEVFFENSHEVLVKAYKSNFHFVHWELTNSIQGTHRTDFEIFALGFKLLVDFLNFSSVDGKCKIIVKKTSYQIFSAEIMTRIILIVCSWELCLVMVSFHDCFV